MHDTFRLVTLTVLRSAFRDCPRDEFQRVHRAENWWGDPESYNFHATPACYTGVVEGERLRHS